MPLLGDPRHAELVENLQLLPTLLPRPGAILVVSAHWEAPVPSLTGGANPPLIYDYYNFPPEAYRIGYPAPGHPQLAAEIASHLRLGGFESRVEARGFDHGLFVPLKLMYPDADIPCLQLSLLGSLDAEQHLALGEALRGVEDDLLLIGSGFSFHNQPMFRVASPEADRKNREFESWLIETCADPALADTQRRQRLLDWENAPSARFCHPREEHLLPLHVCAGFTGRAASRAFELTILGKRGSTFLWT